MNITEILIESPSPYNFEETIDRITRSIAEKEWKMPAFHDLQQTLKNSGKEVLPVKVFEICKPKFSGRILELDKERIASSLMPCRISVYEHTDGKVYISRLNTAILAAASGGIIEEVMRDSTHEIEQIIEHALKE